MEYANSFLIIPLGIKAKKMFINSKGIYRALG
jgi:hypothetical protein